MGQEEERKGETRLASPPGALHGARNFSHEPPSIFKTTPNQLPTLQGPLQNENAPCPKIIMKFKTVTEDN